MARSQRPSNSYFIDIFSMLWNAVLIENNEWQCYDFEVLGTLGSSPSEPDE